MMDPSEDEIQAARAVVARYRKQVNETPPLLSLLYDIDLLPEQIVRYVNAKRLVVFCELFKRLTPEAVADLFGQGEEGKFVESGKLDDESLTE
jgi:hypothetical protein